MAERYNWAARRQERGAGVRICIKILDDWVEGNIFCFKIAYSICEICATLDLFITKPRELPTMAAESSTMPVLVVTPKTPDLLSAFGTERRNRSWDIGNDSEERVGGRRSFEIVWRTFVGYCPGPAKSLRTMASNSLRLAGSTSNI